MGVSDFQISSMVRRILVSVGFDTSGVNIGVYNGVVYLKGKLEKKGAIINKIEREFGYSRSIMNQKLTQEYLAALKVMDKQIVMLPGVRGVIYRISGWNKIPGVGWSKEN